MGTGRRDRSQGTSWSREWRALGSRAPATSRKGNWAGSASSALSRQVGLNAGDLIYTGTPAGVSAVRAGDTLVGRIEGLQALTVTIV